jgi:hypothetical protein
MASPTSRAQLALQDRPHVASGELCGSCAGRIGDQEYRVSVDGICFHRACDLQIAAKGDLEAAAGYRRLAALMVYEHSRRSMLKRARESEAAAAAKLSEAEQILGGAR